MLAASLLFLSILLQIGTVVLALRLIPLSRGRTAWLLISAAILVRTLRHVFEFALVMAGEASPPTVLEEVFSCAASLLLFSGVLTIGPLFAAFRESEKKLQDLVNESRDLQHAAQQAERAKDEFLAGVSHELRTPLTVLIGSLDLVESPTGTPQPHVLKLAREAAQALQRLIEDLLDSARVGTGRMRFLTEPFSPHACFQKAVEFFQAAAERKGLALHLAMEPGVPELYLGDAERLSQVLRNLLDNAVKFTHRGQISVSVSPEGVSPDGTVRGVLCRVADTGCGIPLDKVPLVFQNFYQVDMSSTRLYRGMGLGLGLSQALIEGMGGRIWVEATGAGGTTVSFVLPCQRPGQLPLASAGEGIAAGDAGTFSGS